MNRTMPSFAASLLLLAPAPAQASLDERFCQGLPPAAESLWTQVPWRTSLTDALVEARALGRPIYLFVNDGEVSSGRC
jgi:hypothetical protein